MWIKVFTNYYPVLGVLLFDWSVFAIFYAYWLETFAIGFFTSLFIGIWSEDKGKWMKAIRFMVLRTFMLLFYLIFIIAFVGVIISSNQGKSYEWITFLVLIDDSFRFSIIGLLLIKFILFINSGKEQLNHEYPIKDPFFDSRQIVIHVSLVLGVFAFARIGEWFGPELGLVIFTFVFASIKTLVEYFSE